MITYQPIGSLDRGNVPAIGGSNLLSPDVRAVRLGRLVDRPWGGVSGPRPERFGPTKEKRGTK